jgi:hypothetical protein
MIPYILHVSILIAAGVLFYRLVLKQLTFYVLNRWVLLGCLVAAFLLPLLPVPRGLSWMADDRSAMAAPETTGGTNVKTDKQTPAETGFTNQDKGISAASTIIKQYKRSAAETVTMNQDKGTSTASTVMNQDNGTSTASTVMNQDKSISSVSAAVIKNKELSAERSVETRKSEIMAGRAWLPRLLFYLYLSGVVLLGLNLLRQMVILLIQRYKGPVIRDGQYHIVTGAGMHGPCSFGKIIFIHPGAYDPETYQQILLHEKIHAGGWHTLDILIAEMGIIFQWFNPFIWQFRREMENNLEFLTDRNVLRYPGVERTAYQLSLVKVAAPGVSLDITSNYNQSLLKRRIIMMNAQNSSRGTAWKYFFLLPLFLVLAAVLNRPAALAQNIKEKAHPNIRHDTVTIPVVTAAAPAPIPSVVTDAQNIVHTTVVSTAAPAVELNEQTVVVGNARSTVEANVQSVVSANVETVAAPSVNVVVPAAPSIYIGLDTSKPGESDRTEGAWFIVSNKDKKDESLQIELRGENDDHHWSSSFSVPRIQLSTLKSVGKVEFSLSREAGTIFFSGQFDGEQGFGHYKFVPDAGYLEHMREKKIVEREDELMSFYMLDIKKGYVDMLQANGYPDISKHHLISMAALHIDEDYVKSIRAAGYRDLPENQLITFKALKIDGDYLRKFPASTRPNDIVTYKSLHIDSAYIASLSKAGYPDLPPRDIVTLKSLKVDADYIKGFNDIGYKELPVRSLISFKSMNITPEYVKGFLKIGYEDIPANTLISFKSMDITPEYLKSFQEVGWKIIPRENITSLKSMNITPAYVKGFLDLGYKDINPHQLVSLKAMNITPDFVKAFNSIGFKDIPLNQLSSLKAMGVTADYVSKMKEKGFVSDDLNKYIRLKSAF